MKNRKLNQYSEMKNSLILLAKADYAATKKNLALYGALLLVSFVFCDILYLEADNIANQMAFFTMSGKAFLSFLPLLTAILFIKSYKKYWRRDSMFINMLPASRSGKFGYMIIRDFILIPGVLFLLIYGNYMILNAFTEIQYPILPLDYSTEDINHELHTLFTFLMVITLAFPYRKALFLLIIIFAFTVMILPNTIDKLEILYKGYGVTAVLSVLIVGAFYSIWLRFKTLQLK